MSPTSQTVGNEETRQFTAVKQAVRRAADASPRLETHQRAIS